MRAPTDASVIERLRWLRSPGAVLIRELSTWIVLQRLHKAELSKSDTAQMFLYKSIRANEESTNDRLVARSHRDVPRATVAPDKGVRRGHRRE